MYYSSRRDEYEYVNEHLKSNIMLIHDVSDKVFHVSEDQRAMEGITEQVCEER